MSPSSTTSCNNLPHHFKLLIDHAFVTRDVLQFQFKGEGTQERPHVVEWTPQDPRNPQNWPTWYKWLLAVTLAIATLAVSFCSSAYSGGLRDVAREFEVSDEAATLGISLFVLGFALGPMLWAPLSELYGRQVVFFGSFCAYTAFNAGASESQNVQTLLILRFLAGSCGSSPLSNVAAVIADIFDTRERGVALSLFCLAPFLGPVLGPVAGGFLGESKGWRWIGRLMTMFSGTMWVLGALVVPETYAPVLLRRRASKLSKLTGKAYRTKDDVERGRPAVRQLIQTNLIRPWVMLFREPIVLILSIYLAIIYGILYMLFGAFPIVYQQKRQWTAGIAGLPFPAIAIGMVLAVAYTIFFEQPRYVRLVVASRGHVPPEARLPVTFLGSLALPVGLLWWSWTNSPSVPWPASVAAAIPFGFGTILLFMGTFGYFIDAYTIFAASAAAANSILRSLFGAAFPLFTVQMYGRQIRLKSKYAAEADAVMAMMRERTNVESGQSKETLEESAPAADEV